ncbi:MULTISPECIES: DUF4388 domain-containing protein [unclassified Streptomyces]|uniref:DUF4388 domain-containing protein n=1 Tax=unclassified Streptomyces TaxID=2593676 RepID=UPI002E2CFB8E|nr:hypothetical protein [Streptomyces sp. NBC_00223]
MTAVPEHRREPRNVPSLLSRLRQDRFTGAVEVEGGPGGTLFLHDGLVVAVESPAAPSARSLLLRSQRIDEQDWEAALAAVTESEPLASVLTGRGLITAAELFVVCTAAVFDGAFAMSLQPASGWRTDPGRVPELAARPGQEPARLTEETALRLRTLREQCPSVGEFARTPVRPAARADLDVLDNRSRTLLLSANGRRTPRDLAFAVGRGVYPVMLDLARLTARRFVVGDTGLPSSRPLLTARAADPPTMPQTVAAALPRRRPGGNLPPGRPADGPSGTSADQRNTVGGLRLIRAALLAPTAAMGGAEEPPGVPGRAVAGAAEPPDVESPVVGSPTTATPVAEPPVAVRGTETGRPEETAP